MEKIVEQGILYDFYGELLTEHQRKIYEAVVYNDLSLSEIAEEAGISRQGVHDLIRRCNILLQDFEDKLHLVEKFGQTKERAIEISSLAARSLQMQDDMDENSNLTGIFSNLTAISNLAAKIIEEL